MVKTAFNKRDALEMLETFKIFGNITEKEYLNGKKLIKKEFENGTI